MMLTDDIKAKIDLLEYIGRYVPLKKAGRYHKGLCPFHNEKTPSFTVDESKQTWRCYGCNAGGDLFSFAMQQHGWSFSEALKELAALAGIEIKKSPTRRAQEQLEEKLIGVLKVTVEAYQRMLHSPAGAKARDYLLQRGLTAETIKRFQLGYAPSEWDRLTNYLRSLGYSDSHLLEAGVVNEREGHNGIYDLLRDRLVIPICNERGQPIALAGRTLADAEPKYLNSPTTRLFDKSHRLFGYRRDTCRDQVIIVEGYMDAMQAHQAGFTNVVAQMGTALTDHHLILLKNSERIVIALDGDKAGQAATHRSIATLVRSERDVRIITMPDGNDPDDVIRQSPDQWTVFIEQAEGVAEYIVRVGCAHLPDNAPLAQRLTVAKRLIPLLMACETLAAKWNVQLLAQRLGLPAQDLMDIAQPVQPEPDIILLSKPGPPLPLLEIEIIAAFCRDQTSFYEIQRKMREWDIPVLSATDFSERIRFMFSVLMEAINQYDMEVPEYMESVLPPDAWQLIEKANQPKQIELSVQMLRMKRVQAEIQALMSDGRHEDVQRLVKQKMVLQQAR